MSSYVIVLPKLCLPKILVTEDMKSVIQRHVDHIVIDEVVGAVSRRGSRSKVKSPAVYEDHDSFFRTNFGRRLSQEM